MKKTVHDALFALATGAISTPEQTQKTLTMLNDAFETVFDSAEKLETEKIALQTEVTELKTSNTDLQNKLGEHLLNNPENEEELENKENHKEFDEEQVLKELKESEGK